MERRKHFVRFAIQAPHALPRAQRGRRKTLAPHKICVTRSSFGKTETMAFSTTIPFLPARRRPAI